MQDAFSPYMYRFTTRDFLWQLPQLHLQLLVRSYFLHFDNFYVETLFYINVLLCFTLWIGQNVLGGFKRFFPTYSACLHLKRARLCPGFAINVT